MAVDLTPAFHVALYLVFLESLLFFAVIMQTKSVEPGTHSGVARYFGLLFLFQSLSALFLAISEQLYRGYISIYTAVLSCVCLALSISLSIPASISVALPEPSNPALRLTLYLLSSLLVLLSTFALAPHLPAAPDIPYVSLFVRKELLAGVIGAVALLAVAATVRMLRQMKGKNGAFILLAGLALIVAFGVLWGRLEPICQVENREQEWPDNCPVPEMFDHNFMIAALMMFANVLMAEGVLRLMAAGSGVEGYVEIIPIIQT